MISQTFSPIASRSAIKAKTSQAGLDSFALKNSIEYILALNEIAINLKLQFCQIRLTELRRKTYYKTAKLFEKFFITRQR
jgi:hypothetical protein